MSNLSPSKNDWNGSYVPKHSAKILLESMDSGNCPLLPDSNCKLIIDPIYNVNTGRVLNGKDLIPAQVTKVQHGYESKFVATKLSIESSKTTVKQGEKGLFYNWQDENGKFHHSSYFFADQTSNPENILDKGNKQLRKDERLVGKTLQIDSVENYLPMYLAACRSGADVTVSKEIAAAFEETFKLICKNELATQGKNKEIQPLNSFIYDADKKSLAVINANWDMGKKINKHQDRKKEQEICL